jgi:hypothetical protein
MQTWRHLVRISRSEDLGTQLRVVSLRACHVGDLDRSSVMVTKASHATLISDTLPLVWTEKARMGVCNHWASDLATVSPHL